MDYRHAGPAERIADYQKRIAQCMNTSTNYREDALAMVRNVGQHMRDRKGSNVAWAHVIVDRYGMGEEVPGIALDKARLALGLHESVDIDVL
jgi:hypothetical protein